MVNSKWLKSVPAAGNVSQSDVRRIQEEKARRGPQTNHDSPPVTTTPHDPPTLVKPKQDPSPKRDFNKRANSLDRDAMPAGLFPGSTFKVYNALYLRSLGAVVPSRRVRASRRDFLDWTDIRNLKTVDNHIRYLMAKRLIIRHWELGSTEGSEYEVFLPEEVSPPLTTTPHQSPAVTTSQNMTGGDSRRSGSGGDSQIVDPQATYGPGKTSFKTKDQINDDEAFAEFLSAVKKAAKEITGREPEAAEAARWGELAEVLVTELKMAAGRTTVSSVPAFLAEHLRRRLWKLENRKQPPRPAGESEAAEPAISREEARDCPDCFGTGMYYPGGFDKGVARCGHLRLKK
jgi:hypothetical protein